MLPLAPVSPPRLQLAGPSQGLKFYIQTPVAFDLFNMLLQVLLYVMSEREAPSALSAALSRPPGLTDELLWGVLTAGTEPV